MNIYHFAVDRGRWDTENWIAVADCIDIAKEIVYASFVTKYGDPIESNKKEFLSKLDSAEVTLYSVNEAVDIWQSFD